MSGNAQKTWIAQSLQDLAQRRALSAIQLTGKALPVSVISVGPTGAIVTVQFDLDASPWTLPQVTVPVGSPEWVRWPLQAGSKGVVLPASARLGGITGLGSGTASLAQPANLSALVFWPVGNAGWSATDDPQAVVLYGPNGAIIRTADATAKQTINADKIELAFGNDALLTMDATKLMMQFGANSVTIDAGGIHLVGPVDGAGDVTTLGVVTVDGLTVDGTEFFGHEHSGVTSGSDPSGPVI